MKNLIYYIYFNGNLNHYHALNLSYLRKFWNVFDGKKVVKIAVDGDYDIFKITELLPLSCEFQLVKNNPAYGESDHFLSSLNDICGGQTFYAHCKGVSRPRMEGLDYWINKLYESNLSNTPSLNGKLFSGICGKLKDCSPYVPYPFHYSGSFYWFDTENVKSRLQRVEPHKYLTECFPAMIAKESECQFNWPSTRSNPTYYDIRTWKNENILFQPLQR